MAKYNGNGNLWPAIGIDLGSTNSCVAVWKNNHAEIIPNDMGDRTTPSYVAFGDKERSVGENAKNQGAKNFPNTIYDTKRIIGKSFKDDTLQDDMKLWPFKVINSCKKNNKPMIKVTFKGEQKNLAAEEISAMVLLKMKETAEAYLGREVKNAVVSVPAYFNDAQRQATRDAGTIAGLNVMNIINESTAAAVAYGIQRVGKDDVVRNVLIFDLGGGTLDVSLVRIKNERFKVNGVKGDTHLGGIDFVNNMVRHFVDEFRATHGIDMSGNRTALIRLKIACEKVKRDLSSNTKVPINVDYIHNGIHLDSMITREKFEDLNSDLFERCLECLKKCLKQANIKKKEEVNDIVLVGGSTRIPKIQGMLKKFFKGREPSKSGINLDEVVAQGAAIQAAMLSGARTSKDFSLTDVAPFSIGYKNSSGNMEIVVPRGIAIPTTKNLIKEVESHEDDDDKGLFLSVYEGGRANTNENNFLGSFELPMAKKGPFNLKSKGAMKHSIWFEIDRSGILTVSVQQVGTIYEKKHITILNHNGRLSEKEISEMVEDAQNYNEKNKQNKLYMDAILALKKDFDSMWDTMNVCHEKFKKVDSNMEDVIQDISQYLHKNTVLDNVRDFENKLKSIQCMRPQ